MRIFEADGFFIYLLITQAILSWLVAFNIVNTSNNFVNLIGSFLVSQKVAKYFIQRGKGSIVNVASVSGIVGNSGRVAYGASKGGVINPIWCKIGIIR